MLWGTGAQCCQPNQKAGHEYHFNGACTSATEEMTVGRGAGGKCGHVEGGGLKYFPII